MSSNGYPSSRTGQATEALLDKVEKQCITVPSAGTNFDGYQGRVIIVDDSGGRNVKISDRLTHENVVVCNSPFVGATNRMVIASPNKNEVRVSDRVVNDAKVVLAQTDITASDNNKMVLGSGTSNSVKASSRVTDSNAVIANTALVENGAIIFGNGNSNQLKDTCGISSAELELIADANQHAKTINRNVGALGTINYTLSRSIGAITTENGTGTLSSAGQTALANAIAAKNGRLIGSILSFTFGITRTINGATTTGSLIQSAEVTTALKISDNQYKIGALFNTYYGTGVQVYMLTIDTSTGAYTVNTIVDTTINELTVQQM